MITKKIALFVSIAVMSIGITGIYAQNEPDNYDPMSAQDNERVNTAQNDLMGGLVELVDAYSDASMEHHQNEVIHISKDELRQIVDQAVQDALAGQAAEMDARLMDRLDTLIKAVHDKINSLEETLSAGAGEHSHDDLTHMGYDNISDAIAKISAGAREQAGMVREKIIYLEEWVRRVEAGEHSHDDLTQMVHDKINSLEETLSAGAGEHSHDDLTHMGYDNISDAIAKISAGAREQAGMVREKIIYLEEWVRRVEAGEHSHDDLTQMVHDKINSLEETLTADSGASEEHIREVHLVVHDRLNSLYLKDRETWERINNLHPDAKQVERKWHEYSDPE